jgi:cytochrome c oxidase subunit 4
MVETHITPVKTYVIVAAALVALTLTTIGVSYLPLGPWHVIVSLAIATIKATLVVIFFMHARYSGPLTRIVIIVALVWFGIMILGTVDDYVTRTWLSVPGH